MMMMMQRRNHHPRVGLGEQKGVAWTGGSSSGGGKGSNYPQHRIVVTAAVAVSPIARFAMAVVAPTTTTATGSSSAANARNAAVDAAVNAANAYWTLDHECCSLYQPPPHHSGPFVIPRLMA